MYIKFVGQYSVQMDYAIVIYGAMSDKCIATTIYYRNTVYHMHSSKDIFNGIYYNNTSEIVYKSIIIQKKQIYYIPEYV